MVGRVDHVVHDPPAARFVAVDRRNDVRVDGRAAAELFAEPVDLA